MSTTTPQRRPRCESLMLLSHAQAVHGPAPARAPPPSHMHAAETSYAHVRTTCRGVAQVRCLHGWRRGRARLDLLRRGQHVHPQARASTPHAPCLQLPLPMLWLGASLLSRLCAGCWAVQVFTFAVPEVSQCRFHASLAPPLPSCRFPPWLLPFLPCPPTVLTMAASAASAAPSEGVPTTAGHLPVIDLNAALNLKAGDAASEAAYAEECAKVAAALREYSIIIVRDPRVSQEDNDGCVSAGAVRNFRRRRVAAGGTPPPTSRGAQVPEHDGGVL